MENKFETKKLWRTYNIVTVPTAFMIYNEK